MRILVDADACPVRQEIIRVSRHYRLPALFFLSVAHHFDAEEEEYVEYHLLDNEPEAVDIALLNETRKDDIVVTQDIGLAAMVLARGAAALSPRGVLYQDSKMSQALAVRHALKKAVRGGQRVRSTKKFSSAHARRFLEQLESLIENSLKTQHP